MATTFTTHDDSILRGLYASINAELDNYAGEIGEKMVADFNDLLATKRRKILAETALRLSEQVSIERLGTVLRIEISDNSKQGI